MIKEYPFTKLPAVPTPAFPDEHVYQPLLPVKLVNPETTLSRRLRQ